MKDLQSHIVSFPLIDPATYEAASFPLFETFDRKNFESLNLLIYQTTGTFVSGYFTVKVEHSDDNITFYNVEEKDILPVGSSFTNGIIQILNALTTDTTIDFGYIGDKQYIKVTVDAVGSPTSISFAIAAVAGHPTDTPYIG